MAELHVVEASPTDVTSVGELGKVVKSSVGEQSATVVKLVEEEQGKELVEAQASRERGGRDAGNEISAASKSDSRFLVG